FLPIEYTEDWGKEILKIRREERKDNFDICTKNGFNIRKNAVVLENKYDELISKADL
ncbi:MAG: hypothetical protein HUK25_01700, partial [Treponema sp.]|nr:hypothetical protein [Treponema sp.]